jgi:pilus assembly protein FimV
MLLSSFIWWLVMSNLLQLLSRFTPRPIGDALKIKSLLMGRFALKSVALAAMVFASSHASALGLGRLAVQSSLGETLRAEIDVSSLTPEEASNLQVKVASPDAYRVAGVDYNAVLPSTKVVLQRRADGKSFLRVTSDRAVQEPFVDVILEISWTSGRLVREYTMLFDPPATRSTQTAAPAPETAPAFSTAASSEAERPVKPSRKAAVVAPRVDTEEAPAPAAPRRAARKTPAATAANAAPSVAVGSGGNASEVKVRQGDYLTRIATRVQKPGVSLDQMVAALYQANPLAFQNNNINRLKSGVVLAVPDIEAAKAISNAQARQIIQAQSKDFGAYRQRLGGAVTTAKTEGNSRQAKGTVQAAVEDGKQGAAPAPDKLTLTKGAAKASAPEARASKEQENKQSTARVAELSKNVEDLKKLSGSSAASSTKASAAATPEASKGIGLGVPAMVGAAPEVLAKAASAVAVPMPTPLPTPLPASLPTFAPEPKPTAQASVAASVPTVLAAASSVSDTANVAVVATVATAASAASAPMASMAGEDNAGAFWENPLALAVGGGLLTVLAGFGAFRFIKRAKKDSGETSFLESRLQPDSFFGASGGQRVDTRDGTGPSSSMSYSLSQLDAIGDVDPVAEADVYLAYGRDLQAEEILKEAMRTNPERLAVRTKLLEVYAKRRDTKGFELLATQLFSLTGGKGVDWEKAQEIGRQIDGENQLYQAGGVPPSMHGELSSSVHGHLGASTMPQSTQSQSTIAQDGFEEDSGSEFPSTSSSAKSLDLDLGNFAAPAAVKAATAAAAAATSAAVANTNNSLDFHVPTVPGALNSGHGAMDFDLSSISLDLTETKQDPAPKGKGSAPVSFQKAPASPSEPVSLNLTLDDAGSEDDPVAVKLKLAEEFEKMGELEGARDLLQEVIASASGSVKIRAQTMLDGMN